MRMKIPITGTVASVEPNISGEDIDPIRMVRINLGNISWKAISLDLENEEMEIEVTPAEHFRDETGVRRKTTASEKQALIEHARNHSLERMSKAALYAMSNSPRLKNPFKET